jgi:hypothetical protein
MSSPRRARSRYAGRFCLRSVTFTSAMRTPSPYRGHAYMYPVQRLVRIKCMLPKPAASTRVPLMTGAAGRPKLRVTRSLAGVVPSDRLHPHGQCLGTVTDERGRASPRTGLLRRAIRSYRARRRCSVGRGSHFVFADRRDARTTSALVVSVVTENPNLEPHRL